MRISDWSSDVCSSDLIVVGNRGRNVGHQDRLNRANIDAHFHRCRTGQEVDVALLELLLEITQPVRRLLRAMFFGTQTGRSGEHTSELQSLMRLSYAVFCLKNTT